MLFPISLVLVSFLRISVSIPQGRRIDSHKIVPINGERHDSCTTSAGDGLCMYQWECTYTGGVPLGICKHGFHFGACCVHDVKNNEVQTILTTEKTIFTTAYESQAETLSSNNVSSEVEEDIIESHTQYVCGISSRNNGPSGRIVNGTRAAIGEFPWQVSIMLFKGIGKGFEHHCGGVLLNERWVATAAHCLLRVLLAEVQVRVGEYDFSNDDLKHPHQDFKARRKVLHPDYRSNLDSPDMAYENDIALLQLRESAKFKKHVAPICLPASPKLLEGQEAVVTGWGRLEENGTTSNILQKVLLPILNNEECEHFYREAGLEQIIPDIFMCAGFKNGEYDACNGDSGGPLQTIGHDGRYILSGLVSWGNGCGERNKPGVYTRVSKYISWILETIAQ